MTRIGPGAARVLLAAAGVGAEGALPQHVVAGLAVAVVAVVAIAGIMSGLTLGLVRLLGQESRHAHQQMRSAASASVVS